MSVSIQNLCFLTYFARYNQLLNYTFYIQLLLDKLTEVLMIVEFMERV